VAVEAAAAEILGLFARCVVGMLDGKRRWEMWIAYAGHAGHWTQHPRTSGRRRAVWMVMMLVLDVLLLVVVRVASWAAGWNNVAGIVVGIVCRWVRRRRVVAGVGKSIATRHRRLMLLLLMLLLLFWILFLVGVEFVEQRRSVVAVVVVYLSLYSVRDIGPRRRSTGSRRVLRVSCVSVKRKCLHVC